MSAKCHFIIKAWPSLGNWLTWLFLHSMALYIQNIRHTANYIHNIHRWRASNMFYNCDQVPALYVVKMHQELSL